MILKARQFEWSFPRPVVLMGIVNVTPDSFSDGGRYLETAAAIEHGLRLEAEGAEMIDVGGESTRPGALPVGEAEELRRVLPVIEGLAGRVKAPISIDTYKPVVARAALSAGASIVNDITAGGNDGAMWRIVAEARAGYVVMHMQGNPATMQIKPSYQDVKTEVGAFFESRLPRLAQAGVQAEQVILDLGIGFGKTRQHNLDLLAELAQFRRFGRPILAGMSRKSFLGACGAPNGFEGRLAAGLACACWAAQAGANIIRTHDVRETLRALRIFEELLARNDKR